MTISISTYIIALAALFLLWMATMMHTKNLISGFIFKFSPLVLSFLLGLIAFKVIV